MENVTDVEFLMTEIVRMSEIICFKLRQEAKTAACVNIKIRYPDFETFSQQTTIPYTSNDDEIIPVAKSLINKLYKKNKPVRLLGVKLSDFNDQYFQANLFADNERKKTLYKALDELKNRFGRSSVVRASGK
jgi:DNA polymerase-4